ncbi:MAG TPA: PilN domain-containing protein [Tepidisphaeraceae bacterium]|nr:PilN domain-containing protein [Tepidisphaeraceae bacterium]
MNRINLLPDHYMARQHRQRLFVRLAIAAGFTVLAGVAWGAVARVQLGRVSEQIALAQSRLAQEQQRGREIELRAAEGRTLKEMLVHRGQLESPVASAGVLALLTHLLPESIALTRLSLEVPAPDMTFRGTTPGRLAATLAAPPQPQPTRVVLEGLALSDVELAQVVSTLAGQTAFRNVKLVRSRQVPLAGEARFGFEISLEIPPTVAAHAGARAGEKGQRGA